MPDQTFRNLNLTPAEANAITQGRYAISVIGIDNYAAWPKLRSAMSDAQGIEDLFTEKFGFLKPVPALLNEDATEDAIL